MLISRSTEALHYKVKVKIMGDCSVYTERELWHHSFMDHVSCDCCYWRWMCDWPRADNEVNYDLLHRKYQRISLILSFYKTSDSEQLLYILVAITCNWFSEWQNQSYSANLVLRVAGLDLYFHVADACIVHVSDFVTIKLSFLLLCYFCY